MMTLQLAWSLFLLALVALIYAILIIPAVGGWAQIHDWTRRWRKRRHKRRSWR